MKTETLHIGIGVLASLLGLAFFIYSYASDGRTSPDASYHLEARFKAIDGINEGARVLLAGIAVGHVSRQRFESESHRARVEMEIDSRYEIPYDSAAMILSDGIFGAKYIKIIPGGALDMLEDGDEFEFVQDSVIFEELLEKVIVSSEKKRAARRARQATAETEAGQ